MPELPEVETARRAVEPHVVGRTVARVVLRVPALRWPLPPSLAELLPGQTVLAVHRRAKYLILRCTSGSILLHLGMSGGLRLVPAGSPAGRHDHIDLEFTDGCSLRFSDPRRFGAFLWTPLDPSSHPLLVELGPEPFAGEMDGDYLYRRSRGRKLAVKPFIMDQRVVVGVGNIYASEALFRAGIDPRRAVGRISARRYENLALAIRTVLDEALAAGSATLGESTAPGYFPVHLQVYGRPGQPCPACRRGIVQMRLAGRSTFYCRHCQR